MSKRASTKQPGLLDASPLKAWIRSHTSARWPVASYQYDRVDGWASVTHQGETHEESLGSVEQSLEACARWVAARASAT